MGSREGYGDDHPAKGEHGQAHTGKTDRWAREHAPVECVERGDCGHADEGSRHEGEQDQPVNPGLIAVDQHRRSLAE